MTDTFNYPQSSCLCTQCNIFLKEKESGTIPTNMSVPNCKFSRYYDCNPKKVFKVKDEPNVRNGNILLNSSVVADNKFSQDFRRIDSKSCPGSSCPGITYQNSDPRLYNAAGVTWLQLDRPPLDSSVKLRTLNTDKSLNGYGQGYRTYSDINAGEILYYVDKELTDAFFEPLFSKKATTIGTMYRDPMGAMKPQWERFPKEKYDPILCDKSRVADEFCTSFMKDTQYHREDLLARQMRKRNEQRFETRWFS